MKFLFSCSNRFGVEHSKTNFISLHKPCTIILYLKQVTDASLLTITGFPAFAVGDESLCQQAKDMVVEKLEVILKTLYIYLVNQN